MSTYIDNTPFVQNLKNGSVKAGNSGKIDSSIAIGIGILLLIGGGFFAYQNIQLRNTVKILNLKLKEEHHLPDINS